MGPPVSMTVGMLIRRAAIRWAGSILSQLLSITMASKRWPSTMSSTVSAMASRLGRE